MVRNTQANQPFIVGKCPDCKGNLIMNQQPPPGRIDIATCDFCSRQHYSAGRHQPPVPTTTRRS